jgi:hypothetical protein
MRKVLATIALMSAVSNAAPVFGQNTSARCANSSNTDSRNSRDSTYCFDGESVGASVVGPGGQSTHILRPRSGPSLIRIRAHFVPEMVNGVENF